MDGTHFKEFARGGSIKRKVVNPDLQEERDKCDFDKAEMQHILLLPGYAEYYKPMLDAIREDPNCQPPAEWVEMTRDEQ